MRLTAAKNLWKRVKKIRPSYTLLAFIIPFVSFLSVMIVGRYEPFGNERCMLYSDMYHQYYPFFVNFRQNILEGNSLLYNWDIGMGLDYLGLFAYYLASPLNLVSILIPESLLLEYFSLLAPLKIGLASLFFSIFLKKAFGRNDFSISLFGSLYGLCAWAMGYHWNVMWLDTFALLPLVVLGVICILRERKFILYTVSLFLCIFANYYVGLFVCIFVFLFFWLYEICRFGGFKKLCIDLGLIAVFTVLAIGMTAILSLPTLSALQTTQSGNDQVRSNFAPSAQNTELYQEFNEVYDKYLEAKEEGDTENSLKYWLEAFDIGFRKLSLNFPASADYDDYATRYEEAYTLYCQEKAAGNKKEAQTHLWEAWKIGFSAITEGMWQVAGNMGGGVVPNFKSHLALPNIYCGVIAVLLGLLFLLSGRVTIREKVCGSLLLILISVSFVVRQLDYIWHGFHFTNMIPYRFSFLYSFVLLVMAYRAWTVRESFKLWQLLLAGGLSVCIFAFSTHNTDYIYLAFNFVFLTLYLAALLLPLLQKKLPRDASDDDIQHHARIRSFNLKASTIFIAVVLGLELIFNTVNFGVNFSYTGGVSYPNYPKSENGTKAVVRYMQESDPELFYRTEVTHAQTLNDSALIGYHGISTFTSSANVKVTKFTSILGAAAKDTYNRYCYEQGSPISNLFLGLKYSIDRDVPADSDIFQRLEAADTRNGFMVSDQLFTKVAHSNGVYLYKNNAYLPLGFLVDSEILELDLDLVVDDFYLQNRLLKAASGTTGNAWSKLGGDQLKIVPAGDCTINSSSSTGSASYTTGSELGNVVFKYTADRDGYACINISRWYQEYSANSSRSFVVKINGEKLFTESYSLPEMLAVGEVKKGDVISMHFICEAEEKGSIAAYCAILNYDVFWQAYDRLNASTLQLTTFEDTLVEGTIQCNRDGLLYTSIPQNGNWHAYVDGEEVPIVLLGDCMICVELTEGNHTVTFRYENEAFQLGWKISLVCLILFLLITAVIYIPKRRKGKYEKHPHNEKPDTPPTPEEP